jgi:hypothetical protein
MNLAQALHATARRYCDEHYTRWTEKYSELPNGGRDGYDYTWAALGIFPRYNVLNAIRLELDRMEPAGLPGLEETRALILEAGINARDMFTDNPIGPIDAEAMRTEREAFIEFVRRLSATDLVGVEPLPYNHVISDEESKRLWQQLRARWNIPEGYWYPLAERSVDHIEAFQDRYFLEFCSSFSLRNLLASRGISRIWELREHGLEYEQGLEIFDPYYDGTEGYWSSGDLDWIIYASHESSITVGGWLLDEIKKAWPEWHLRIWESPFF